MIPVGMCVFSFKAPVLDCIFLDNKKSKEVKETNFIRQNVLRCSYRGKVPKKADNKE